MTGISHLRESNNRVCRSNTLHSVQYHLYWYHSKCVIAIIEMSESFYSINSQIMTIMTTTTTLMVSEMATQCNTLLKITVRIISTSLTVFHILHTCVATIMMNNSPRWIMHPQTICR